MRSKRTVGFLVESRAMGDLAEGEAFCQASDRVPWLRVRSRNGFAKEESPLVSLDRLDLPTILV